MKRLLGALSLCSSSLLTVDPSSTLYSVKTSIDSTLFFEEPNTTADAVFNMLITLCDKASNARLVVTPICQYLESSKVYRKCAKICI